MENNLTWYINRKTVSVGLSTANFKSSSAPSKAPRDCEEGNPEHSFHASRVIFRTKSCIVLVRTCWKSSTALGRAESSGNVSLCVMPLNNFDEAPSGYDRGSTTCCNVAIEEDIMNVVALSENLTTMW